PRKPPTPCTTASCACSARPTPRKAEQREGHVFAPVVTVHTTGGATWMTRSATAIEWRLRLALSRHARRAAVEGIVLIAPALAKTTRQRTSQTAGTGGGSPVVCGT